MRCTFETSKRIKELGFNEPCNHYFEFAIKPKKNKQDGYSGPFGWKKGELILNCEYNTNQTLEMYNNDNWFVCSCPTHDELITWLYEKHNLWVSVLCDIGGDNIFTYKIYLTEKGKERCLKNGGNFSTPEDARLSVFDYVLNEYLN